MNTKTKTTLALILVAALLLGWLVLQTDWDARAIRKQLNELVELVEKPGPVSTFEALGRSRKIPDFFADGAQVEYFPGRSLRAVDPDALGVAFLHAWGQVDHASIRLGRHKVEIDSNATGAESTVVVTAKVAMGGREQMGDTLKYRIVWVKESGTWRILVVAPMGRL